MLQIDYKLFIFAIFERKEFCQRNARKSAFYRNNDLSIIVSSLHPLLALNHFSLYAPFCKVSLLLKNCNFPI